MPDQIVKTEYVPKGSSYTVIGNEWLIRIKDPIIGTVELSSGKPSEVLSYLCKLFERLEIAHNGG